VEPSVCFFLQCCGGNSRTLNRLFCNLVLQSFFKSAWFRHSLRMLVFGFRKSLFDSCSTFLISWFTFCFSFRTSRGPFFFLGFQFQLVVRIYSCKCCVFPPVNGPDIGSSLQRFLEFWGIRAFKSAVLICVKALVLEVILHLNRLDRLML